MLEHIQSVCDQVGVDLIIVRRKKCGMIERWNERRQMLVEQQERGAIALEEKALRPVLLKGRSDHSFLKGDRGIKER